MSGETITTWADGFGLWHARVTTKLQRDDGKTARELARNAIVQELRQREGPNFDSRSVQVEFVVGKVRGLNVMGIYKEKAS